MNPRIKELHLKAGFWASEQLPFTNPEWVELRDEKFAELLIKECANIARQTETDDSDDYKSGRTWASLDILEHFGV